MPWCRLCLSQPDQSLVLELQAKHPDTYDTDFTSDGLILESATENAIGTSKVLTIGSLNDWAKVDTVQTIATEIDELQIRSVLSPSSSGIKITKWLYHAHVVKSQYP